MKNIEINDTKIPIDTTGGISKTAHDQLLVSRDAIYVTEVQADFEVVHATVLTAHAHQVAIALDRKRPCWRNEYPRTNSY